MTKTAWLIEVPQEYGPPLWLGVQGHIRDGGVFYWTTDAHYALRFSREQDANMVAGSLIKLADHLPHSKTVPHLREGGERAPCAVEHMWMDDATDSASEVQK